MLHQCWGWGGGRKVTKVHKQKEEQGATREHWKWRVAKSWLQLFLLNKTKQNKTQQFQN